MASRNRRVREAARTGKVLRGANFETKSQRKARRKRLTASALANRVADARLGMEDRAAFYRRLRVMKMRRRAIADAMLRLSVMVGALQREVGRIDDRGKATNMRLVDDARALTKDAAVSAGVAAAEFHAFSRARIYFRPAVTA